MKENDEEENDMKLGLSVYPEQESPEQIETYLKTGAEYGFDHVFTSIFSVDGTKEEIVSYFRNLTDMAHRLGYMVDGDVNTWFFEKIGASCSNLSVFKEMGIDILRMDGPYGDERDAILINNPEGIGIEYNTSMIRVVDHAIANGANVKNISTCHNFYPQRYTAPCFDQIRPMNDHFHKLGIPVAMFLNSQVCGTHGPWPVSDGLPTIEEHRSVPVEVQLKHMLAMKTIDLALFGNAFADRTEFEAVKKVMDRAVVSTDSLDENMKEMARSMYAMHGRPLPKEMVRIPFSIHLEDGASDVEKERLYFGYHADLGDCLNYMIRSRLSRMAGKKETIVPRPCEKKRFERGDVLIVNDNCRHYAGEIQIVLKPMENDGQRNLIGHVDEKEHMIFDRIGAMDLFTFVEV